MGVETLDKICWRADVEAAETARKHLEKLGLKTKVLKSSLETELAKLFETTYRA